MKLSPIVLLLALAIAPLARAGDPEEYGTLPVHNFGLDNGTVGAVTGPDGDSIGSLPLNERQSPGSDWKRVKKGDCHTNADGVTVCNDPNSSGNAKIDPKDGNAASETEVRTYSGFEGTVSGMDANDTCKLASGNVATVEGTGGMVEVSGGSSVTVNNTGGAGATMTVVLPSGTSLEVSGGSSVTITT